MAGGIIAAITATDARQSGVRVKRRMPFAKLPSITCRVIADKDTTPMKYRCKDGMLDGPVWPRSGSNVAATHRQSPKTSNGTRYGNRRKKTIRFTENAHKRPNETKVSYGGRLARRVRSSRRDRLEPLARPFC
jgi:hypothetical protein